MSQIEKLDSVAIILGFYNDKKYINAQVQSIFEQTHKNIKLFIFDDNSTFKLTKSFLKLTPENKKKLSIIRRKKNIGSAKNFLFALKEIKDDFAYYGFSDQDDIWEKDKIKISINALNEKGNEKPILFSSRTEYFNEDCTKKIGESKVFKKKPTFANSLIQNFLGGNTILMNKKAQELIASSLDIFRTLSFSIFTLGTSELSFSVFGELSDCSNFLCSSICGVSKITDQPNKTANDKAIANITFFKSI